MTIVYGKVTALEFVVVAGWLFCVKAAAVTTDDLEQLLGEAVHTSLRQARITVKDAACLMRIPEPNLYSMLRGDGKYHLALVHLARLPFGFWSWFGPSLFYLVAKQNVVAIGEELGLRKSA